MQKRLTVFSLFFVVLLGFMGCENDARHAGSTGSKSTNDTLTFVESSTGLPNRGQWRHGLAFYDINLDGHLDILAPPPRKAAKQDRRPYIWLGNGKGEWSAIRPRVPKKIPYDYGGIAAGDFNGDGIPDMGLAIHVQGLKALRGKGNDRYGPLLKGLPTVNAFATRALVAADFNNDGIDDMAAVSEGRFGKKEIGSRKGAMLCLGSKRGWKCRHIGSEKETAYLYSDEIICGDVNGDGNLDVGIASLQHKKDLIVWLGNGKGDFVPFNEGLPTERHYRSIAFADINGDGRDDLIASITGFVKDGTMVLKAFLSEETGFKDMSMGLPDKEVYYAVAAGDLDGDGSPEIVGGTAEGGLKVFGQKNGKWQQLKTPELPETGLQRIFNAYCVDLNNDGLDDVVVNYAKEEGNSGAIRVFLAVPFPKSDKKAH